MSKLPEWEKRLIADKRGAGHQLKGFRGPELKNFDCPECGKFRMLRPVNHEASFEKKEIELRGITRLVYVDICEWCEAKFTRQIEKDVRDKAQKAQKAITNKEQFGDDISLEDAL